MAANSTSQRTIKGILKNKCSSSSSAEGTAQQSRGATQGVQRKKSQKWDESNILATYRPTYRDYDLMKVNEPSTPHLRVKETASDIESKEATTSEFLTGFMKLATSEIWDSDVQMKGQESYGADNSNMLKKQEKQRQFELKRKLHYNEGLNISLARQLISEDLQSEAIEDENEERLQAENKERATGESNEDLACDVQTHSRDA
ncbi:protein phosphatase inhibitor 2 family member C [Erinaceus europaeus]|uniref:Protein phosphatase inhibitor 2 family member C n=1 Tax=Erinaceus europaeus TaxID=9365 RepID=A0A1S2ZLE6_ERIEU|nr:protein phosphatase inhibitor 2 family member C [Erinaceus europaeus]